TRPSSSWRMILPPWKGPIRCWIYGTSTVPRADPTGWIAHESLYYRLEIPLGTLADQCADRPIGRLRGQPNPGHLSADAWHSGKFYYGRDGLQPAGGGEEQSDAARPGDHLSHGCRHAQHALYGLRAIARRRARGARRARGPGRCVSGVSLYG